MKTFGPPKKLVETLGFESARQRALNELSPATVDRPISRLIAKFASLPHGFTLQSCHGHFLCDPEDDPDGNHPIPDDHAGAVRYRIAYLAICLEPSERGRAFRDALSSLVRVDSDYVQFGSPGWFWEQWVNSYALQVEPAARQFEDEALLEAEEARHVERVRNRFFRELEAVVEIEMRSVGADQPTATTGEPARRVAERPNVGRPDASAQER